MAGGALGHRGQPLRRVALRSVKSLGIEDQVDPTDPISEAVGDIPEFYYTEGRLLTDADGKQTITFTASTLDQTLPHQLGGACKATVVDILSSGTFPVIVRAAVVAPKTEAQFVRLVANDACTASIWCWR